MMVEQEYAKALFELACENKKEDKIDSNLNDLKSILEMELEFKKIMISKSVNRDIKKQMINNVFKNFDDLFLNFLCVLVDNNRFELIDSIIAAYNKLLNDSKSILYVDVKTAKDLTDEEEKKIKMVLENKYKSKTIIINNIVDQNLIGGIIFSCKGKSFDISLKHQLDVLKSRL